MPEVAAVGRDSTPGCDAFPAKREVMKKPPRRNRPRSRQDGGCVKRDGQESRTGRHGKTADNNNETFHDDNKENVCDVTRCKSARSDGCTLQRPIAADPPMSPTRSRHDLIYQQCLGSVIASYLSPLPGEAFARPRHDARRFFDTLTSPGDQTPATTPLCNDHKEEDGNNNNGDDDDNNNTNTSVWLSDSALQDAETSSGVETATSSPPEVVDDVIREQVRDGSKSVALCDVSRISVVSSTSVPREQLSSLGGGGMAGIDGGPSSAFHSTFNYPLHSTLRGTSVRCPSPLPESPASPVRWGEPEICRATEDRQTRQRDLPPPACRRCGDTTPLRRQHARARLERQRPLVDRRRRSAGRLGDEETVQLASISLHATRGSLPDMSDLSTDSEFYERVERKCRRRRRCGLNPGTFEVNVRHRRAPTSCTHCRCQSTRPYVRRSADPLTIFDARRNEPVHASNVAWSRTPSSVDRPSCRRYTHIVSAQPSLQRQTGCVPSIRSHGNDAAVAMETRRRRHGQGVDFGCGHKRLLSKKLKRFSNILCSARAADVTQLTTLGHV